MVKFIIKILVAMLIGLICRQVSDTFLSGGIAVFLAALILDLLDTTFEENNSDES